MTTSSCFFLQQIEQKPDDVTRLFPSQQLSPSSSSSPLNGVNLNLDNLLHYWRINEQRLKKHKHDEASGSFSSKPLIESWDFPKGKHTQQQPPAVCLDLTLFLLNTCTVHTHTHTHTHTHRVICYGVDELFSSRCSLDSWDVLQSDETGWSKSHRVNLITEFTAAELRRVQKAPDDFSAATTQLALQRMFYKKQYIMISLDGRGGLI